MSSGGKWHGDSWTLFNEVAAVVTTGPICPLCRLRSVRWIAKRQEWGRYCNGGNCSNHERKCKWCGEVYDRSSSQGGTRYCSDKCKQRGYVSGHTPGRSTAICVNCGNVRPMKADAIQICSSCRDEYRSQIKLHNLSQEWALRLINATHCQCCEERLGTRGARHVGQIDHDHDHCPGTTSCGACVRGIICNRCNSLAGNIENDPVRYRQVLAYIDR